ncbi:glycoside hydrolase family 76 protein [Auriculariales sp. MPI-PUGE-AT-0066]|nr:glycoside hydrolase family 76 protein [Auriculariales sp. MPI-PUGE-AT-0066]
MRIATSLSVLAVLGCAAAAPWPVEKRAQCASTLQTAVDRSNTLLNNWFNLNGTGQLLDGSLWTDTNAWEDLHNLMLATGARNWDNLAETCFLGKMALRGASQAEWESLLAGSNDDAQWMILSLWKMGDYRATYGKARGPYDTAANYIYNLIVNEWDTTVCGGGIWWSKAHTYKNAITNQLWLFVNAAAYLRFGGSAYLDRANKAWAWLSASGMRNSQGLWNDGLTSDCKNNGQTTWTYNQGVIASGLGSLYAARGSTDTSLLDQAEITLNATMSLLTVNGILKESCDNAVSSSCNHDQQIFKGIWTKHLQFYLDAAPADRVGRYRSFLEAQRSAVFHYGTGGDGKIGNVWYAPSQGGSLFTPETTTSGIAAHVAAAKYGVC